MCWLASDRCVCVCEFVGGRVCVSEMDLFGDGDSHIVKYKGDIRAIFDSVDVDSSGIIEKEEFVAAVENNEKVRDLVKNSRLLSGLLASNNLAAAFEKFDSDREGSVSFDEFWEFCKKEADEENIRSMFDAIDADGSRYITKEELVYAFKNNTKLLDLVKDSKFFGKLLAQDDWEKVIQEMDTDKSGQGENKIDYPEFWKWCNMISARVQANILRQRAQERTAKINNEKRKLHDEVVKRVRTHTFKNGATQGGIFTASIVPDQFNFKILPKASNPNYVKPSNNQKGTLRPITPKAR